jgi:hypothetical protein
MQLHNKYVTYWKADLDAAFTAANLMVEAILLMFNSLAASRQAPKVLRQMLLLLESSTTLESSTVSDGVYYIRT